MRDNVVRRIIGAAVLGLIVAVVTVGAQQAPQQTPPPQTPPAQTTPPPGGREGGRGQGRGRPATFPAQQRQLADQAVIDRGRSIYSVTCSACHGVDLRGGQLGGPNLLRSQVLLNDQHGELILPIVRGARADKGMPPINMSEEDVTAVAEYMHAVAASSRGQGAPPENDAPPPDPVVGDASAGQAYFTAKCSSCHSPTGDLQGIATRVADPRALQNLWVSGGLAGRGRGGRGGGGSNAARITATVVSPSGERAEGDLLRLDDFLVTVRTADGSIKSFRRDGDVPKIDIRDPREAHRNLLTAYTDKDMHDVTAYLVTLK
jgi:cytochrome c oxidase cbb3-type subunit 3